MDLAIGRTDFSDPALRRFLAAHLADMAPQSPTESQHALDLDELQRPGIRMWSAYLPDPGAAGGSTLVGTVALAPVADADPADHHEEVKSMRTSPTHRGRGIATQLLRHALDDATNRAVRRLSLETGSMKFFAPARALYQRHGFIDCPPFGHYTQDPHSTYMTLAPPRSYPANSTASRRQHPPRADRRETHITQYQGHPRTHRLRIANMQPPEPIDIPGSPNRRVAVIGAGVAGLTAAYVLSTQCRVSLLEADDRLGGHAHTHDVPMPDGRVVGVDSGFIVHNDRTYPTLLRLFDELDVATQATDMSMSVRAERTGLEYAGARGLGGLFPTLGTLTHGRYLRMLGEVVRFHRAARRVLDGGADTPDEPLAEFLARERFSRYFIDHFLLPLVAAVWSCDDTTAAAYPARYLFTFLDHHGMLTVFGSPTWRTVTGGSARYVSALADVVSGRGGTIRTNTPVVAVSESHDGVTVTTEGPSGRRSSTYDAVVIACHPHQALRMLPDADTAQRNILGDLTYLPKPAVLHTDTSLLPRATRARASWNYQIRDDRDDSIVVTYDLTRLMRLPELNDDPRMLVTMGRTDLVDERSVLAEMTYEHPTYTTTSVAAQALLPTIDTDRVVFAGAYHGWGFHEDGAASGVRAAQRLGVEWMPQARRPAACDIADDEVRL